MTAKTRSAFQTAMQHKFIAVVEIELFVLMPVEVGALPAGG